MLGLLCCNSFLSIGFQKEICPLFSVSRTLYAILSPDQPSFKAPIFTEIPTPATSRFQDLVYILYADLKGYNMPLSRISQMIPSGLPMFAFRDITKVWKVAVYECQHFPLTNNKFIPTNFKLPLPKTVLRTNPFNILKTAQINYF